MTGQVHPRGLISVRVPFEHTPGADLQVDVARPDGSVLPGDVHPIVDREVYRCGCVVLVAERASGGSLRVRVDNRPAGSQGRCTREHLPSAAIA